MTSRRGPAAEVFRPQTPTLIDILISHARWRPGDTALTDSDGSITWKALGERARTIARSLELDGAKKGDRVAVLGGNCIRTVEVMLGIAMAGAVIVPLSNQVLRISLWSMIADSGARWLFADDDGSELLGDIVAPQDESKHRLINWGKDETRPGWVAFDRFVEKDDAQDPTAKVTQDDPASLLYTSGTTGVPKGMIHTHRSRYAFAASFAQQFRMHSQSTAIAATALFTTGTWLMWLPALYAGATLVILPKFDRDRFIGAVAATNATHTFLVPTIYEAIADLSPGEQQRLRSMQVWVSAGSALRTKVKNRIDRDFPGELLELYGCSEGFTTVCSRKDRLASGDAATVGKPPLGWDVKAVRDDDTEASTDELGELVGTSEFMLSHYHANGDATQAASWSDGSGRTYVRSGDVGRIAHDGYVYVVDRKKDMINSGGANIFAADVEAVLLEHPALEEAAVVAAPHERWGETPVAFVVPSATSRDLDADGLRTWANSRLAKYQRISRIFVREQLPRNALGKVVKRELRDALAARTHDSPA